MPGYEVKPVVCDYGLYEDDELRLVCNSSRNAKLIKAILEKDCLCNRGEYCFDQKDFIEFRVKWYSDINMRCE